MMAITSEFMDAVQAGKLLRVHIMMKNSLLVDPTGGQFNEMEQYAAGKIDGLYVEHDGEKLNFDVGDWNEDYLNRQMVVVVNNFSRERIELLKSMVRFLYKDKAQKIRDERNKASSGNRITRKQVGTGVTVAGAALTVAGICTSHTILTIGGVAVAVAGVALIASDKGNE